MGLFDMPCGRCEEIVSLDNSKSRLSNRIRIIVFAMLCAIPFSISFFPISALAPYLALIIFVPSMFLVRQLRCWREIVLFALLSSAITNILITFWLPHTIRDALAVSKLSALAVSVPLWTFWGLATGIFLLIYRYLNKRWLAFTACLGVVLFNHWPSIFGVNPYLALLHANGLSGGAYFVGTSTLELAALLVSVLVTDGMIERRASPFIKAVLLMLGMLLLDAVSSGYLRSVPSSTLNVALVQTDNVYGKKLSSAQELDLFVQEIADAAQPGPDLVVFPESVFTFNLADDPESGHAAINALKAASLRLNTAFMVSAVQTPGVQAPPNAATRVTSMLIDGGELKGFADKASTIPFAEYTPAWAIAALRMLGMETHSRAPATDYQAMRVKGVPIIPLSCFESLDKQLIEQRLVGRPGLLVNQSNLDSFGEPGAAGYMSALWQHMAYEQRWVNQWQIPLVRAVRGGGSTTIDAQGNVDLQVLDESWGQEMVRVQVTVREATARDGLLGMVRDALDGLICLLALVGGLISLVWLAKTFAVAKGRTHDC